jgi:hypothetical protein
MKELLYDIVMSVGEDWRSGRHYFSEKKVIKAPFFCKGLDVSVNLDTDILVEVGKELKLDLKKVHELTCNLVDIGTRTPRKHLEVKFKIVIEEAKLIDPIPLSERDGS